MDKKDEKVPASIRNHPAVIYAVLGEEEGSDYKYWVELHHDWRFTRGAKEGGTGGGFNNVKSFQFAAPKRINSGV